MSQKAALLKSALKNLLTTTATVGGVVVKVNEATWTCDVKLPNTLVIYDVQLTSIKEKTNGCVLIPKEGANVDLLNIGEDTEWLVISMDEVDKVVMIAATDLNIDAGGTKLLLNKDLLQINDGSNGGIPITPNIVKQLNTIEKDLNSLKNVFKSWSPASQDGGAALKLAAATWFGGAITPTQTKDIENAKAKH